ncbi:Uncharacterised protein [Sphingobacterium mizutaii]|uniref:Uncharacterized protein n=4 Tax=Sphingobacterium TaxID=28453 RepID=A0AAJ4XD22_9SPHI|nr:hypothetical protein SAMN05192578_1011236 [Sphingobacterium mizutaii]SNV51329.1 Uncharacterised protein [Sphingobacterium mizutaii]
MIRFLLYIILGVSVSFFLFPIAFTFLPSLNTKMVLAVLGVMFAGMNWLTVREIKISKGFLLSVILALLFSFICYYSTDINKTTDYAYASYILSFAVWYFGAYAICSMIKIVHGKVDFKLVTYYVTAVCVFQCAAALMIDNIPSFKQFVDSYVSQGQEFFDEVERLYGIGAALDPAGVRFTIVLLMITAVLNNDEKVRNNAWSISLLLISFFFIAIIGNAISRTTILGLGASLGYLLFGSSVFRKAIKQYSGKLSLLFGLFLAVAIGISIYLYNTNIEFYDQMRFAFEGFFNYVEKGEWRTDSTDKLNREMWVWPEDQKTWLIGSGLFDNFVYGTDIGYCRFILYSGLIGFSVFALLFVVNALVFMKRHPEYWMFFLILLVLTFIIWFKVATDIFFIYAVFYCIDSLKVTEDIAEKEEVYEDSVLHPRYI